MEQEPWWVWPLMTLLGMFGAVQLWNGKVRPWIEDTWEQVTAGDALITLPGVGALDETDLIGLGILLALVLAVVIAAARRWRARRAARIEAGEQPAPKAKAKSESIWTKGLW